MADFISPFSKRPHNDEDDGRLRIRSKPLIWCLLISCYLLMVYCLGFVIATVTVPIVGIVFGISNKRLEQHKA